MARRRRRRAAAKPVRRRRRRSSNPPVMHRRRRRRSHRRRAVINRAPRRRSSRRRYRSNPSFSVRGILGQAREAATTAVTIVGGKVLTRVARNYIPGGKPTPGQPLSPMQILIELGAATLVGYLGRSFMGQRVGANLMAGGFVGVVESLVKTYKVPVAADALGDDGDPNVITIPASMSGYVREQIVNAPLNGYVRDGSFINGPGLGEPPGSSGIVDDGSGTFEDAGFLS